MLSRTVDPHNDDGGRYKIHEHKQHQDHEPLGLARMEVENRTNAIVQGCKIVFFFTNHQIEEG